MTRCTRAALVRALPAQYKQPLSQTFRTASAAVSVVALTLSADSVLLSEALAAEYAVRSEAELVERIATVNMNGDADPVIVLTAPITATGPIPPFNRSITINTNGFRLSAVGSDPLASSLAFKSTVSGTVLKVFGRGAEGEGLFGGDAAAATSQHTGRDDFGLNRSEVANAIDKENEPDSDGTSFYAVPDPTLAGIGLKLDRMTVINSGTIAGGSRRLNLSASRQDTSTSGVGLHLVNGTLINSAKGVISGGTSLATYGAKGAVLEGNAPGTQHLNDGLIKGGAGSFSGSPGVELDNAILSNNGRIVGGAAAGFGGNNDGALMRGMSTIINNKGGIVAGLDATDGGGSWGGDGISLRDGEITIVNHGTITGGSGATRHTHGIVDAEGSGTVTIINGGIIQNGTGVTSGGLSPYAILVGDGRRTIVELHQGSEIRGLINVSQRIGNDVLRLSGGEECVAPASPCSFDVSEIGSSTAAKYANFDIFEKTGSGTWMITGTAQDPEHAGRWDVFEGTLLMSGGSRIDASVVNVFGGTLAGFGIMGTTINHAGGMIAPGSDSIGTLIIDGDYVGRGGLLQIETELGDDNSPADRLQVHGNVSGKTNVQVTKLGGEGKQTLNNIKIIDVVGGTSTENAFELVGDYVFEGEQAIVAGPYAYRLVRHAADGTKDHDWYLRSELATDTHPTVIFQPGAPLYESYAGVIMRSIDPGSLQQRLRNRRWSLPAQAAGDPSDRTPPGDHIGTWAEIRGLSGSWQPAYSTTGTRYDLAAWKLEAGVDLPIASFESGRLLGGLSLHYGTFSAEVNSAYGNGSIGGSGSGVAGTLTWYADNGFYLDGHAQAGWFDNHLEASGIGRMVSGNEGFAYAFSLEMGKRFTLSPSWSVTPQAQLTHSEVKFDNFTDVFDAAVSLRHADKVTSRLGITLERKSEWQNSTGHLNSMRLYGTADLYYDLHGRSKIDVAGVGLSREGNPLWGGVGLGGSIDVADGNYSFYGEALAKTNLENVGDSHSLSGMVGFRAKW